MAIRSQVLANEELTADWDVNSRCEVGGLSQGDAKDRTINTRSLTATVLIQFRQLPARYALLQALEEISTAAIRLVEYAPDARMAVIAVPNPVPVRMLNRLAKIAGVQWLEADCGHFHSSV